MQSVSPARSNETRNVASGYPLRPGSGSYLSSSRSPSTKVMDSYPVLQIVRCRLGPEAPMEGTIGYPFTMAPHSHSHLPRTGYNTHLSRNQYRHPCGTLYTLDSHIKLPSFIYIYIYYIVQHSATN